MGTIDRLYLQTLSPPEIQEKISVFEAMILESIYCVGV